MSADVAVSNTADEVELAASDDNSAPSSWSCNEWAVSPCVIYRVVDKNGI